MQLQRFIDALRADLNAVAELGDDATAEAAGRLTLTLQASVGLRLLDALSEAVLELNEKLPSGHVEVRLAGQDPQFVYVSDEPEAAAPAGDEAFSARITLRLPEALKTSVEEAAAKEGVSVNTYIVRALSRSGFGFSGGTTRSHNRLTGYAQG
jgi:hypothetical protein